MTEQQNNIQSYEDEISLKEIIIKIKNWLAYLKTQWWKIAIAGIIGGLLGYGYAYIQPITYTAKLSFVVEDSKSSGGGLASLAGLAGIDIGGMSGGAGTLFAGDNILLFLKSESLVRTTLLTPYDSVKNYSLADKYADVYKLRKRWATNEKVNQKIYFPSFPKKTYSRLQDSLLQSIVKKIIFKELEIERPDKKATFINVSSTMKDELLVKLFSERLVNMACDRYVYSKTKRQKTNVDRLQRKADSLGFLLNIKTYAQATETEKLLDINPALRTESVRAEVTGRDKMMIGAIFTEVVKNLEVAKMQLSQETPTIYMVDGSDLPAKTNKLKLNLYFLVSALFSFSIIILFFTFKHLQ
jgi:hypothetical protein